MKTPATNRQKKLLNFFKVPFGKNISSGAAGWEIDGIMSDEVNREKWRRYLYLTQDFDADSDQLKPYEPQQLATIQVPDDFDASKAVHDYRVEMVAKLLSEQSPFDSPQPNVVFENRVFVFTGKFEFGTRMQCQEAVAKRGGIAFDSVSHEVDYLVIGTKGNPAWSRGTYGNKIEEAIMVRREHGSPSIISENHWKSFL